jgi:hypothetical protein
MTRALAILTAFLSKVRKGERGEVLGGLDELDGFERFDEFEWV